MFGVVDDERLLGLPDPAGRMAVDGGLGAGGFFCVDTCFQNVETHDVARGIVEGEGEEVEFDDGMKALGEVVEKRGEIALLGDDFADFEQGFELAPGVFERRSRGRCRRRNDVVRHSRQDNTRVESGSTEGEMAKGDRPKRKRMEERRVEKGRDRGAVTREVSSQEQSGWLR